MAVRVPQIVDISTAIRLYYTRIELSNSDIRELFGSIGSSRIVQLKNLAKKRMIERNRPYYNAMYVNTEDAFEAWGLDIGELERRYAKLRKMGLMEEN